MIKRIFNSTLFRNSQIYLLGTVVNSVIPLILLPILTRVLSPADYGIVSMFQVITGIVFPILGLSMQGAIILKYFHRDNIDLPKYIGNCFFVLFFNTFLISFLFLIFGKNISSFSGIPKDWLWAIIFICLFQFIIVVIMTIWQGKSMPVSHILYQSLQSILGVGLSILFVVVLRKGWQGRIEAQIVTMFILGVASLIILFKNGYLKFVFDFSYLSHCIKYGISVIPHELGALLMMSVDKILLTNMRGITDTGVYSVGCQVVTIIDLIFLSFNKAYLPWLFEMLKKNDTLTKLKVVKLTYLCFVLIFCFCAVFAFFSSRFLVYLVGNKFVEAQAYIVWLSLGFVFHGMYYMLSPYVIFAEKAHILSWVTLSMVFISTVLNYYLIKFNGALGAAQCSVIVAFLYFISIWFLSAKAYKMPWLLKSSNK